MSALGDCYAAAGRFLMDHDGVALVHGSVLGTGGDVIDVRFGHAWIEAGPFVIEVANGRRHAIPREAYYEAGAVRDTVRYSKPEALALMLRTGHFGPWDPVLDALP